MVGMLNLPSLIYKPSFSSIEAILNKLDDNFFQNLSIP